MRQGVLLGSLGLADDGFLSRSAVAARGGD